MNASTGRSIAWATGIAVTSAAVCAVLAIFVTTGTLNSEVVRAIAAAIVYAVPLLALQAATEKVFRRWADASRFPVDWIVYGGAKLILGLASAAIGSSLALLLGIIGKWQDLYIANRMVVVVSVIASCVARLYSTTRSRLEERNLQLERNVEAGKRKARLHEQDFERAREIQQQLMPKHLPQLRGFQFAATCQPARSVGGDYHDAIPVGDSSVAIVIGDVSGKAWPPRCLCRTCRLSFALSLPPGLRLTSSAPKPIDSSPATSLRENTLPSSTPYSIPRACVSTTAAPATIPPC